MEHKIIKDQAERGLPLSVALVIKNDPGGLATSLRIETWGTMTSISKSKTVAPLSDNPPGYIGNALITIDYPNGLQPSVQSSQ